MRRFDGLIFDKDGTLFSFDATWGEWTERILARLSRDVTHRSAMARTLGFDPVTRRFDRRSPVIAGTPEDVALLLRRHLSGWSLGRLVAFLDAEAADVTLQSPTPLRPLLESLGAAGLTLGLATNDSEAAARAHLQSVGVEDLFRFIAGYDSGYGAKPTPGMLHAFLDVTGHTPGRCAMIGDSLHDLHAGRSAGMATIGVLTGPADRAELEPHADHVLGSIAELGALVLNR